MKTVHLMILIGLYSSCKASLKIVEQPTRYSTVVEGESFQGVIFSEDTECTYCFQGEKRFSPTLYNVQEAEEVLKDNLRQENAEKVNQGKNCPVIHKNLNNYRRQYFGYINQKGDSIIYTIFEWSRYSISDRIRGAIEDNSEDWKKEMVLDLDGCSRYWTINIDITEEKLFNLRVNGVG
ncbi:hypothetical protein [Tunicatimonas pelagia]|uniref:hypothetical protein n=1 Tax=Tunicatimonas pelagia TaxID=931531 RepID=UPI0026670239|nr:hypothetical protein [Tunicatimonas pelagia]WKN44485.1 hypothetical protein P0M28_05845 [Tunicatimonas pelagia]